MTAREELLNLIRQRPDITAPEAAGELRISKQRVYVLLRQLGMKLRRGNAGTAREVERPPAHTDGFGRKIHPHSAAAICEMVTATDLLRRGFDVYQSVTAYGKCDLVAVDPSAGKCVRVEVKSAWRKASGTVVAHNGWSNSFDVLAMVFRDGVVEYRPEIGLAGTG